MFPIQARIQHQGNTNTLLFAEAQFKWRWLMRLSSEAILLIPNQEKGSIRIMLKLSCWLSSVASQLYGMGSLVLQ